MCLLFDIEATFPCCTRTDLTQNNGGNQCDRGGQVLRNTPCASYDAESTRAEAAAAVDLFAGRNNNGGFNNDNTPFYNAFASAWNKATTNGWTGLQPLSGLEVTSDTTSPTNGPVIVTSSPTPIPTSTPPPSPSPTLATSSNCVDETSFLHKGKMRDCNWVMDATPNRCKNFSIQCPVSCDACHLM